MPKKAPAGGLDLVTRAVPLGPECFLVMMPVGGDAPSVQVRQAMGHDWVVDCSYSMYEELPLVVNHLCQQVDFIPDGDRLSTAYFSSEGGENDWFLKNHAINGQADREAAKQLIRRKIRPYGTTCFSEVLSQVPSLIEDSSVFGLPRSFALLTDGKPVVSWGSREEMRRVRGYLQEIEPLVVAGLFVGYGQFYDRENLMDMTKAVGGNFIHADSMRAFNMALQTLIETGKSLEAKARVALSSAPAVGLAFTVVDRQVNFYEVEDGAVKLATGKGAADRVFYLSKSLPKGAEIVDLDVSLDADGAPVFASTALALRGGRQDLAIDIASRIGDVALVEALDGAMTNPERGRAEQAIFDATFYAGRRFSKGRRPGEIPPADKFCLIDLLTMLMNDDEAYFYVKLTPYKYIGPPSVYDPNYPKFNDAPDARTRMDTLSWNKELLNLSLQCTIKGTVELRNLVRQPDGSFAHPPADYTGPTVTPESLGLPRVVEATRFAKRTIVKDGTPWTTGLAVSMSAASFMKLQSEGVINATAAWAKDKPYALDVSGLKVVNRAFAEGATSAEELCKLYLKERRYYGQLKALRAILADLDPEKKLGIKTSYSEEQVAFLALNGVSHDGTYNAPKSAGETTDYYMAHVFKIGAKGLSDSSFKNPSEVQKKLDERKKLTLADEMVHSGMLMYQQAADGFDKLPGKVDTRTMKVDFLRQTISAVKAEQLALRGDLAKRKVAVALNHRWFDEASGRDQSVFFFDGLEYTIVLDERKEKF